MLPGFPQLLGRLPWLAALFLRAFFLRDFLAMVRLLFVARLQRTMVVGVSCGPGFPHEAPVIGYRSPTMRDEEGTHHGR